MRRKTCGRIRRVLLSHLLVFSLCLVLVRNFILNCFSAYLLTNFGNRTKTKVYLWFLSKIALLIMRKPLIINLWTTNYNKGKILLIVVNKQRYQHMIGYKLLKFLVSQANLCSKINIKWMQDILNSKSIVLYYCSPSWKFHNLFCKFLELEILWKHASMVELIIDSSFFNPSKISCKAQWLFLPYYYVIQSLSFH